MDARSALVDTCSVQRARSSLVLLAVAGLSGLGLGCGGAPAGPRAPDAPAAVEASPRTIEDAQAAIARARAEIDRAAPAPQAAQAAQPGQPSSPPAPPPPSAAAEPNSAPSAGADACAAPCRALASMRRAVGALCELTGSEDLRCAEATRTLAESEARVGPCACR